MQFSSDPKTIGFMLATTPAKRARSLESVTMPSVACGLEAYEGTVSAMPQAQNEAVMFYLSSHLLADIQQSFSPQRPLNAEQHAIVKMLLGNVTSTSARFYFYLLKIVFREYRHCRNKPAMLEIYQQYCPLSAKYLREVTSPSSEVLLSNMMSNMTPAPFGNVLRCVEHAFYFGSWSTSYGGPKWGVIARVLRRFIEGQYSPEIMLDVGWALAHNGGPIFNKGYFYGGYCNSTLLRVLDLQRAGEIPAGIIEGELSTAGYNQQAMLTSMETAFGLKYPKKVDWWKVDRLGATQVWMHKQQQQDHAAKCNGLPMSPWKGKKKVKVQNIMELEMHNRTEIEAIFAPIVAQIGVQTLTSTLTPAPPIGTPIVLPHKGSGIIQYTTIRPEGT